MLRQAMSLQSLPFHNPTCSDHLYIDFPLPVTYVAIGGFGNCTLENTIGQFVVALPTLGPMGP